MKATKIIKNAIELRLGLTENEYEIMQMSHVYGEDKHKTYEVAIINVIPSHNAYVIRVWKSGGSKIEQIKITETYEDAFIRFLTLKD